MKTYRIILYVIAWGAFIFGLGQVVRSILAESLLAFVVGVICIALGIQLDRGLKAQKKRWNESQKGGEKK